MLGRRCTGEATCYENKKRPAAENLTAGEQKWSGVDAALGPGLLKWRHAGDAPKSAGPRASRRRERLEGPDRALSPAHHRLAESPGRAGQRCRGPEPGGAAERGQTSARL